jgi:DNA polymerase-3 subunit gamma/tau
MLGLNDQTKIVDLISKIMIGDLNLALKTFNEIYSVTSDVSQLVSDLQEIVHKITACKTIENYQLEGLSTSNIEIIVDLSKKISLNNLLRIWQLLVKAKGEIDQSLSPKINFEMLLIKLCHLVSIPDLTKILVELKNVDQSNIDSSNQNSNQVKDVNLSSDKNKNQEISNSLVAEILNSFDQAKIL